MKILIVSPTRREVTPLLEKYNVYIGKTHHGTIETGKHTLYFLISGIGTMLTTFRLTDLLSLTNYDIAILAGVAGSYDEKLGMGTVVNLVSEEFSGLGIEDEQDFQTLFEKGFFKPDMFPFTRGKLLTQNNFHFRALTHLKQVKGITSDTVHGKSETILQIRKKFEPAIESMEGAAFFYVCKMKHVPFLCLRAISNFVEVRDETKWNIPLAVKNLCSVVTDLIHELTY
jgi:futalosine hydrolase